MIWQCVWNGGQVEPLPLSGAISACVFFRLNSKQPSASEMTTLQRRPQSYTLMDMAVYLCCWFQWGNCDCPPPPPHPTLPSHSGEALSELAKCREPDRSTVAMIGRQYFTLAWPKLNAFQNIAGNRCVCVCVCEHVCVCACVCGGYLQYDQSVRETLLSVSYHCNK